MLTACSIFNNICILLFFYFCPINYVFKIKAPAQHSQGNSWSRSTGFDQGWILAPVQIGVHLIGARTRATNTLESLPLPTVCAVSLQKIWTINPLTQALVNTSVYYFSVSSSLSFYFSRYKITDPHHPCDKVNLISVWNCNFIQSFLISVKES